MPSGNSLFHKFSKIAKSPKGRALLETISQAEGTAGEMGYLKRVGGTFFTSLDKKPGVRVKEFNSSAEGKYQFLNETWNDAAKALGLTDFSKESQDAAAIWLANKTGAVAELQKGNLEGAIYKSGKVWQGLPKNAKGESITGKGQSPRQANMNPTAAKNLLIKNLNIQKGNTKDPRQIAENKKASEQFFSEIAEVKKMKLTPAETNKINNEIYQKYYKTGDLGFINRVIGYRERTNENRKGLLENLKKYKNGELDSDQIEAFKKQLEKNKIDIPYLNKQKRKGEYTQDDGTLYSSYGNAAINSDELEKKILTPAYDNYGVKKLPNIFRFEEAPQEQYSEEDYNEMESLIETDDSVDPSVSDGSYRTEAEKIKADQRKGLALSETANKPKAFDPNDLLSQFEDNSMQMDPKFEYSPGKQQIPFDSIASLATGMMGMAAGNVDIKYRDEKVSEAMLNYASELEQIKNIGLPPEIEADLNMKLASAYQTGLSNIVQASNGNRNLVLGNQGQLDEARMKGIVQIAAMDVDRRDKAMAAYGEVQKYINDFNANRDIANNERRYREDEKKQMAGSALAQAGMASLMNSLQAQRENAPGSPNDMMKQFLMFHISGVNKDAKPGEPGHPDYFKEVAAKNKVVQGKKDTFGQFAKNLTDDNKEQLFNYLKENPSKNPAVNPDAEIDSTMNLFKEATGQISGQANFLKEQGVSPVEAINLNPENNAPVKENEFPALNANDYAVFNQPKPIEKPKPIITTQSPNDNAMLNYLNNGMEVEDAVDNSRKAASRHRQVNNDFENYILKAK
jgi:muramidase (phage lysozyme)